MEYSAILNEGEMEEAGYMQSKDVSKEKAILLLYGLC